MSRAERVIAFLENLKVTSGKDAGKPFRVRDWQREILAEIYREGDDGRRLVTQALITMPRKNGKTGLTAGLALAHLVGPEAEARGQVYSAAADKGQAGLLFEEMKAMLLADDDLAARVIIRDFKKEIEDSETGSKYQALSSDVETKHGLSASCIIYDELAQAPNRKLFDVLTTSTGARAEPLTIVISTQSSDPNHCMTELVNYGYLVRDGQVDDPSFFAAIFEAPEDADPWDETTWFTCNPALGDFRSLDEMRIFARRAKRMPSLEPVFRALYLNQRVSLAEGRLLNPEDWKACGATVDPADLEGHPCWGGLDLSATQDLTALVLYWPHCGAVLTWFWTPAARLQEKQDKDRVPYPLWHEQGHLEVTPGRTVNKGFVAARIGELAAQFDIQAIGYDRWRIDDLRNELDAQGIGGLKLIPFGQGFKDMGPAVDLFETAVLDGALKHPGNPVLTWCVNNAVATPDPAGNRKLDKARAIDRIDGAVALVMAIGTHAKEPAAPAYDFSDMVVVA